MAIKNTPDGKDLLRKTNDYFDLNRSIAANHFRTEKTKSAQTDAEFHISDFFSSKIFSWLYFYLQSRFGRRHKYQLYDKADGDSGIYELPELNNERVVIGVAGDWGTFTPQSIAIAEKIAEHNPHFTIHIGDTYFVGAPHEIADNFTNKSSPWPRGSLGSLALLGNHEMYARGIAYFDALLPTLGMKIAGEVYSGQKAAFFCLENKYWRILGLDTGYHSIGKVPVLEMIPWFAPDCRFPDEMMDWLNNTVRPKDPERKKATLVLTHHQYITAFKGEGEFTAPAKQLADAIGQDKDILWLWGHEHKFSVYEKAQVKDGPTAHGRCIGHGGMPIEINGFETDPTKSGYDKLIMVDEREVSDKSNYPLGFNGYAMIKISGPQLTIEYYDGDGPLFSETWTADNNGGISGEITPPTRPGLVLQPGKSWKDAVK
jgi:hypothetical protein